MKKFLFTATALMILIATTCLRAQVTIGSTDDPQSFSLLELVSSGNRGLRLPQMTTPQREALNLKSLTGDPAKKAHGLQIFNTDTKCVETWNGSKWISTCGDSKGVEPVGAVRCISIAPECGYSVPDVCFMPYNLGADPQYDTPKKQMEYMASFYLRELDARVSGGLYQWGRKDLIHGATTDGTYRLYPDFSEAALDKGYNSEAAKITADDANIWEWWDEYNDEDEHIYTPPPIDENGQPTGDAYGRFIHGEGIKNWYPDAVNKQDVADALWGNGKNYNHNWGSADGGAIPYNGGFYQKPFKTVNDPCPAGFRIPTQDEWERLGAYDCNPTAYGEDDFVDISNSGIAATGNGLTWVKVECSWNRCTPHKNWGNQETVGGYAIYKTKDWEDAIADGGIYEGLTDENVDDIFLGKSLHHTDAPEPLMFLPAGGMRGQDPEHMIYGVGQNGCYWSSTIYNNDYDDYKEYHAFQLNFESENVYIYQDERVNGYSIRCVME